MDAFARGLKAAAALRADGRIAEFVAKRYSSWDNGIGAKIEAKQTSLEDLSAYALGNGEPTIGSGRQELMENILNEFI
jgi:xylose isomerase